MRAITTLGLSGLLVLSSVAAVAAPPSRRPQPRRVVVVPAFDVAGRDRVHRQLRAGLAALAAQHGLRIIAEPDPEQSALDQRLGLRAYILETTARRFRPQGDPRLKALERNPLVGRVLPLWNQSHAVYPSAELVWQARCDGPSEAHVARIRRLGFEVNFRHGGPECHYRAAWAGQSGHEAVPSALQRLTRIEGVTVSLAIEPLLTRSPRPDEAPGHPDTWRTQLQALVPRLNEASADCPEPLAEIVWAELRLAHDAPPQLVRFETQGAIGPAFEACLRGLVERAVWPDVTEVRTIRVPVFGPRRP